MFFCCILGQAEAHMAESLLPVKCRVNRMAGENIRHECEVRMDKSVRRVIVLASRGSTE